MAEKKWTPAQRAAIDIRDRTILVSAAAGSGKTATLTERIIRSLTDPISPAHIEEMLIVTFTRAAAAELRSRIFSALTEALAQTPTSRHLTDQLMKLGSARICTIDSFYLDLLRDNFSRLGLSPNFRIADTAEADVLANAVMNQTIDDFYDNDPDFPLFVECFSGIRSQDAIVDVLLSLDSACASIPEGIEFLKRSATETEAEAELDFFATKFGSVLRENVSELAHYLTDVFTKACEVIDADEGYAPYAESFHYLRDFSSSLLAIMENSDAAYEEAQDLLATYARPELKRLKKSVETTEELEIYKSLRNTLDEKLHALADSTFAKSQTVISRAMHDTARHTSKLYEVLAEYEKRIQAEKAERNFLDFSDIRHYTLRLLVTDDGHPTDVAEALSKSFSYIYIDEYQDVDRVQDTIFRAISRPDNRFMVGDIKQSIYSFRGAEPRVFAEYREAFPLHGSAKANGGPETIFMSNNFRCDESIIDFSNIVCSYLFSFCKDSIGYCPDDDLVFSKDLPYQGYESPKVQVSVILPPEKPKGEKRSFDAKEAEATYIAEEIEQLLRHGKKANGEPIRAHEIAVISRTNGMNEAVTLALQKRGIPAAESGKDRYFEDPDVLMMLSLLNTIDNPQRDIPLAGTLRSPIFGFSLEELVVLRRTARREDSLYDAVLLAASQKSPLGARCKHFCQTLDAWRDRAASLPVDRLLCELLDSEPFVASGLCTQPGDKNGGNLLLLYEYARRFEGSSFKGLYGFIEFINTMMEQGRKLDESDHALAPDRVAILTVHKSKGLEFPVCFVCGTGHSFSRPEARESLLFDRNLGVAMKIADGTGIGRIHTPMRDALLQNTVRKSTEEEMRVLYVALTRARERLYVTGTATKEESVRLAARIGAAVPARYAIMSMTSYLKWILCALSADARTPYTLSFLRAGERHEALAEAETATEEREMPVSAPDEALWETLREKYAFSYPYADLYRVPAKLSVSRLSPDILDQTDTSADLVAVKKPLPDFFRTDGKEASNAAERGTATHLFLQFCDFSFAARHGIKEEFARLDEKKFLPPDAERLIRFEELEAFLKTPLFQEILSARRVIREQRFNILLSPVGFSRDEEFLARVRDERLAVQGVIDLVLEDADGRLCLYDYKTDRLTAAELADPALAAKRMSDTHGLQLSYYAKAAEALFGRPCDRVAVYSTHAARLFDVMLRPLTVPPTR